MIAECTYEQMQALAIKLTQKLCKRVVAGDEDLSEEEAFIVTVVELYESAWYRRRGGPLPPTLRGPP